MQSIRSLALSLAGAVLLPGCFLESTSEPLPLASTFRVITTFSYEYGGSELPASLPILVRLDGAADADVAAMFTTNGGSASGVFVRKGSSISLREPVDVPILGRTPDGAYLAMESIELTVLDRDGDGSTDAVDGRARGEHGQFAGDVLFRESFTAEMSGELYDDAP